MNTPIPLNVFQRLLRRWDLVHPYNAGQVMRIAGAADRDRWSRAWEATLQRHGLGPVTIRRNRYQFEGHPPAPVQVIDPTLPLEQHLSDALNTPFANAQLPFRPFIQQRDGDYWVGVIYSHWIADSVSIRMLLREWFRAVHDPARCAAEPFVIAREGYWSLFGPRSAGWHCDEAALAMLRAFSRFRTVKRLRGAHTQDWHMACLLSPVLTGLAKPLRRSARKAGITVNDLFLAAALEQCARVLPLRGSAQRRNIAMGTIVDLRPGARRDLDRTFGMYLGFSNVMASRHDLLDFDHLLHKIHLQTRHAKQTRATAAGTLWLYLSQLANRYLPVEQSYPFYRKHMPLAAGISNVNLAASWVEQYHPHLIRQYIRVSPTGPMIPVAFTPTTLGDDLQLVMTYRTAILSRPHARRMADGFLDRIARFAAG